MPQVVLVRLACEHDGPVMNRNKKINNKVILCQHPQGHEMEGLEGGRALTWQT
jgi:hypothetical protein